MTQKNSKSPVKNQSASSDNHINLSKSVSANGTKRYVVFTTIEPPQPVTEEFHESFKSDCAMVEMIVHPNIISVADYGILGTRYYISFEYDAGCTLHHIFQVLKSRNQHIPLWFLLRVLLYICRGLQYLYTLQTPAGEHLPMQFSTISPQKIFISFSGDVKLADIVWKKCWAYSSSNNNENNSYDSSYTLPKENPEQPVSVKSHIFSLGVMMYELLSGKLPELTKKMHSDGDFDSIVSVREIAPWVPEEFDAIISQALSSKPGSGFTDIVEVADALSKFLIHNDAVRTQEDVGLFTSMLFSHNPQVPAWANQMGDIFRNGGGFDTKEDLKRFAWIYHCILNQKIESAAEDPLIEQLNCMDFQSAKSNKPEITDSSENLPENLLEESAEDEFGDELTSGDTQEYDLSKVRNENIAEKDTEKELENQVIEKQSTISSNSILQVEVETSIQVDNSKQQPISDSSENNQNESIVKPVLNISEQLPVTVKEDSSLLSASGTGDVNISRWVKKETGESSDHRSSGYLKWWDNSVGVTNHWTKNKQEDLSSGILQKNLVKDDGSHSLHSHPMEPATVSSQSSHHSAIEEFELGIEALKGKRYDAALDHFKQACKLDPWNGIYQANLNRLQRFLDTGRK